VGVEVHGPTGEPVTATLAVRAAPERVVAALDTAAPPLSNAQLPAPELDTAAASLSSVESRAHAPGGSSTSPARATVVVEMADCCGLGRLPGGVPAPLTASSRGLGDAVRAALDLGAGEVVIGVGGSASTDGGAGMLVALGARLLDADGSGLPDGGAALTELARLDLTGLDPRLAATHLVLAADVDSPLLGPTGAAAVFAPQKGATPDDVATLEAALTRWADVVAEAVPASTNRSLHGHEPVSGSTWSNLSLQPGAGAAGGVGFALLAVLGAERRSGADVVLDLVGLEPALTGTSGGPDGHRRADLVVTGEGALDEQTLAGKAVAGVARRAGAHGIPVVAVCGRLDLDETGLATLGVRAAYPLTDLEPDPRRSRVDARELLRRTGRRIAEDRLSPARG
jgi:glycerate kinase